MKSIIKTTVVFSALFLLMIGMNTLVAQEPPHPPTNGHGNTGNQSPGGTAPVGEGVYLMLLAAALYAPIKSHRQQKNCLDKPSCD